LEEPHLGKLMEKMSNRSPDQPRDLTFVDPATQTSSEEEAQNA